jgi:predicted dehydrogenase
MAVVHGEPRSSRPLKVGVIGLGRRWRRHYAPALARLPARYHLSAVCDEVEERARLEARRQHCDVSAGPAELLERPDVDAVLLPRHQWFGLWPLEIACRLGKPLFCHDFLARDDGNADRLVEVVRTCGLTVMVEAPALFAPPLARLRELLQTQLGAPRRLVGYAIAPTRRARANPAGLLPWCAALFDGEPRRLLATDAADAELKTLLLDYGGGRAAQLTQARVCDGPPVWHLHVTTERGTAVAAPGRLHWSGRDGYLTQTFPRGPSPLRRQLEAFHDAVCSGRASGPRLDDAYRLLTWRRLAGRSAAEGRWLDLAGDA